MRTFASLLPADKPVTSTTALAVVMLDRAGVDADALRNGLTIIECPATVENDIADCIDADLVGTFNLAARDAIGKVEFAREVAARAVPGGEDLVEAFAADVAGRAQRPLDLSLDVSRIEQELGRVLPTVREGLDRITDRATGRADA